jgi:stage II sporulation protein D
MTTSSSVIRSAARGVGVVATLAMSLTVVGSAVAQGDRAHHPHHARFATTLVIDGHGYGHGHGMSQYGAEGAALQGVKYRHIVHFYYPGTKWAHAHGRIRVLISADTSSDLQVRPAKGLVVRDSKRQDSWRLPHGNRFYRWRLDPMPNGFTAVEYLDKSGWHRWHIPDGRKTFKTDAEFHAPGHLRLLVPGGRDVVGRDYRGTLRLVKPSSTSNSRETVNVLSLDAYVKGVVPYEMPTSWRQQALRAQAVAARTYAAWQRSQNPDGGYQICDTTSCQVYGGIAAEQHSSNRAVDATAGQMLTYRGKPAFTQFASSSGGWTAYGGVRYLPAQKDPWDRFVGNPMHSWSVRVAASSLEHAHPQIGRLEHLHVTKRDGHGAWGGRVEAVVLRGTKGNAHLSGDDIRWQYGLRSDWFRVERP